MTTLVFDTSPLVHFARAGELEALQRITTGHRRVVTQAVMEELTRGSARYPQLRATTTLAWLEIVPLGGLEELYVFSRYMTTLGNSERNAGEATVLAWAEIHGAIAYVDDQAGCNAGRRAGVEVYRTLGLIVAAFKRGLFDEQRAQELVELLVESDARFPRSAQDDLFTWARRQHLL